MKRYISLEPLNSKIKHVLLSASFQNLLIIVVISLHIRVILNKISGVKYHVEVRLPIGHVYNKVKENKYCFIP